VSLIYHQSGRLEAVISESDWTTFIPMRFLNSIVLIIVMGGVNNCARAQTNLQQALEQGRFSEALTVAESGLKANPGGSHLWYAKGLAEQGLGKVQASLSSYDHALKLAPSALPVLKVAAQEAYAAHDSRAAGYVHRILAIEPTSPAANGMAGVLAYEKQDCAAAIRYFEKVGPALEQNLQAELQYGKCLMSSNAMDRAIPLFERLANQNPTNPAVQYDLALVNFEQKKYADVISILERLRANGTALDGDSLNLLGAAYAEKDRVSDAVAVYRQAIEQNPSDEQQYIDLASMSMGRQSPDVAVEVLNAGIRNNPKSSALYATRGSIYAQIARTDEAQADFETANRLAPSSLYGTIGMGTLLRESSDLVKAETILRSKLKTAPKDPLLNFLLADVLIRESESPNDVRSQEALRLLNTAVKAKPDFAEAYSAMGKLELKQGHVDAAIILLEKAITYDALDRTALNQLVAAYRKAGRTEDASRIAKELAVAVARERSEEVERNRIHLFLGDDPKLKDTDNPMGKQ
jgi:tetratricopeptide (TPR) repeat protein